MVEERIKTMIRRSRKGYILAVVMLFAGITSCRDSGTRYKDAELVFRLALQPNEANKAWEAANLVKQEIERRSGGRIRVMFYPSGVLGNEQQLLETCYLGIIEMVQVTSSVVTTLDPTFDTFDMPFLFLDEDHHQKVLNGKIGRELLNGLNQHELQGLAFYSCGFRSIYANKPVASPEDLSGLKIRVMESPVMIESLIKMGASATPLSASEVFTALKTGVVDGAENNPNVFVAAAHIEAVKYFSLTRHFANQHVLVANKKWLDRIRRDHPDLYELIITVPRDIITEYNTRWNRAVENAFRDIKEQGGTIIEPDRENILRFIENVQPVYEMKSETVPPELVARIRKEAGL
jgi:tripartite ATP-independent transporter DctP family solute receptor